MAKKKTPVSIDPRGQEVVLQYVGAPDVHGPVPMRDLTGGDLNRIAYVRELHVREAAHAAYRRAQDDESPQPDLILPGVAELEVLEAIADELVATGSFARNMAAAEAHADPAPTTTESPAQPAPEEAPES